MTEPERVDRVDVIDRMFNTNQDLHEQNKKLEAMLAAAQLDMLAIQQRIDHLSLGVGQVSLLIDLGMEVLLLQRKPEISRADLAVAFGLADRWRENKGGAIDLKRYTERRGDEG